MFCAIPNGGACTTPASPTRTRPGGRFAPSRRLTPSPATIYNSLPKATPASDRAADTHDRVRRDKIDDGGAVTLRVNGRLHHIGVGRTHARTPVILLVHDLEVRIVAATTGELLRELTIDPRRDYQPTGRRPGPRRTQK